MNSENLRFDSKRDNMVANMDFMNESMILSNKLFKLRLNGVKRGIHYSKIISEIIEKHLSCRPFHLNVIEAACHGKFKETGHSLVLADMLRHPAIQKSFIETFLGISTDYLDVTAETDRVDVALKGDDIFIIIENKINAAEEQKKQVYRYVHEIGIEKYGYYLSQIYVIYLNPTNRKTPSDYSLCDENNENNVFNALGKAHYTIQSYKYDITEWLRNISIENEPHINSALDQYVDFLENKFHTSLLDNNMNNEIKDFLLKELLIDNKPLEEQIAALSSQYEKTEELLSFIDGLRTELRKELSHKMIREWQKQIEQQLRIKLYEDQHSFGVQLKNGVWLGIWDGYDSKENLPYWGFQFDDYKKGDTSEFYAKIPQLLERVGIAQFNTETGWIAWSTTQKGVDIYISIYNGAKEMGLI